jgi:hypothetical protein
MIFLVMPCFVKELKVILGFILVKSSLMKKLRSGNHDQRRTCPILYYALFDLSKLALSY